MADIKREAEAADQMILELSQQRKAASAEPVVDAAPDTESLATTAFPDAVASDPPVVSVSSEKAPSVSDDALIAARKEVDDANQRWKSLQGMINKKDDELDNMRAVLAQVSQKSEQAAPAATAPLRDTSVAADEEFFGEGLVEIIFRRSQEVIAPKLNEMMSRIAELEKSLKGVSDVTAKTSAELFDDSLARQVPDWKAVNVDPAFLAWLNEFDEFSGATRLDLLKDAYSRSDLPRTARFFTAFKDSTGQVTAPAVDAPKKDNVTKLISPGKSKSSATLATVADSKQIWSKDDISRLYDDKRNNRISQEAFDVYERDLFAAQRENRIAA